MVSSISLPDGSRKSYKHSTGMGLLNDITSTEASPAPPVITDQLYDEVIDELGNITKYKTDRHGMSIETIDALGRTSTTERDKNSRPLKITQPDGSVITKTYDSIGNLLTETDALGNKTAYTYEPVFNQVATITDPKGNVTGFEYDAKGNLLKTTDPLGNMTTMAYDAKGLLASVTDANGGIMQYQYDTTGNLIRTIDQLGNTTAYTRDTSGNIASVTDAEGNSTTNQHDSMNRLTRVIDANGGVTSYTYTSGGCTSGCGGSSAGKLLSSITDARGNTTSFEYDERDSKTKEISPMNEITGFSYYPNNTLKTKIDTKGQATSYVYDAANRLIETTYADGTKETFTYDVRNNLTAYSSQGLSISMTYDSLNRKLTGTANFGIFSKTYSYTYDSNGNKLTFTSPEGVIYTYTYYNNNQPVSIAFSGKTINLAYQAKRLINKTLPNGVTIDYQYNADSWLTGIAAGTTLNYQYTHDGVGNISGKTTEHGNYEYNYDGLYQTIRVVNPTIPAEQYTYDIVGNRLTSAATQGAWTYNANNEILGYDTASYTYDLNGNTIQETRDGQTTQYIYNAADRLEMVELPDGRTVVYAYDPFGRRIKKDAGGEITYYLYSDEGLIGEYDANGNLKKAYGWMPNSGWGTNTVFMLENGQYYFYHNDHLGTPQKLTDMNGATVWSAEYTAFGKAVINGAITNNLRFPGQYYDEETGLHYNYHRYYNPETGRYISEDLLECERMKGENLFVYAANNPVNWTDPSGTNIYGNWCGPNGSGPIKNGVDKCCYDHDQCYKKKGKNWKDAISECGDSDCDKVLCECLRDVRIHNFDELTGQQEVMWWFGCK